MSWLDSRLALLRQHEQLLVITTSTVLVLSGQGVIAPVLPLFAEELGVSAAVIGLTLSFFALARFILNVPLGIAADRFGRRPLLVAGPLVTAVGMVGSGFAGDIVQLLAWRLLAGAGSAMYMTATQIYLADISTPATRARFIGTNYGAMLLGIAVGPAIGGITAELWGLRAPFFFVGATAFLTAGYGFWKLPETRHIAAQEVAARTGEFPSRWLWLRFATSRNFLAVSSLTLVMFMTGTAARQTIMPLMADARFDFSPGDIGALFTAMAIVNVAIVYPASSLADRYGRRAVIVPSGLLVAGSLVVVAWSPNVGIFLVGSTLLTVSSALAGPAPAAYAADIAPPSLRGFSLGLYRSSGDLGFMVGPPLLGLVADNSDYGWALLVNAALMIVTALFFTTATEPMRQRPTEARPAPTSPRAS